MTTSQMSCGSLAGHLEVTASYKSALQKEQKHLTKDVVTLKMKLLNDMITTEEKVVNDESYISRCYATVDTLYNKGRLTLVTKKHYDTSY